MDKITPINTHVIELKRGESYIFILDSKSGYKKADADELAVLMEKMGLKSTFVLIKDEEKGVSVAKSK